VILTATVAPDLAEGVIEVEFHGLLSVESAPIARAVLLKCLAQCPDAVIVNISDLQVESRSRLAVFPAALRTHVGAPTALLLHSATAELAQLMRGGVLGVVPAVTDRDAAFASVDVARALTARRKAVRLAPDPGAAVRARALVTDACREWELEHLIGSACLVISELVTNAVQHARTVVLVRVARRGHYLHLSVQDGSTEPPRVPGTQSSRAQAERGRGLHLVGAFTTAWGSNVTDVGKTVWATFRATPIGGPHPAC
jgi:anti-sigma regulatory factor (Ser/Thr protein kinase)